MKVDGSDWKGNEFPKDKSPEEIQSEVIFDRLLFYRRLANISAERLRIINELERLLTEDQDKFVEYLSNNIQLYEAECEFSLDDVDGLHNKDDATYFDEEGNIKDIHFDKEGNIVDINDFHYDKNTTVVQYNQIIKEFILEYLQEIKKLSDKEQIEEITVKLKEAHSYDISQIINAKRIIENNFPLLELLTFQAISYSTDKKKNAILEKSLEEMRNDFKKAGFIS